MILTENYRSRNPSLLRSQLFDAMSVLVRLLVIQKSYQKPVLNLMFELLGDSGSKEPPNLLRHLGSKSSRELLNVLSCLAQIRRRT